MHEKTIMLTRTFPDVHTQYEAGLTQIQTRSVTDILFIDGSVPDRSTILGNLRPEVQAGLLDKRSPVARHMALAIAGQERLAAVHIMAQPPLTPAGIASYSGVLASHELTIAGTLPHGKTTGTITYFVVDMMQNAIVSQVMLPNAAQQNNSVAIKIQVARSAGSFVVGTFNESGNFEPSRFLHVINPAAGPSPTGAVGR